MATKQKKFEVIRAFKDLQDKNKEYAVGDAYPNPANKKVSDKRLKELSSTDNRQNRVYIQEVAESTKE